MRTYDGNRLGLRMRLLIKIASSFPKSTDILSIHKHRALPDILTPGIDYFQLPNFYEDRDQKRESAEEIADRIRICEKVCAAFMPEAFITEYLPVGKRFTFLKEFFTLRNDIGGKRLPHEDMFSKKNIDSVEQHYEKIHIASDPKVTPLSTDLFVQSPVIWHTPSL